MLEDQSVNPYAPTVAESPLGVKSAAFSDRGRFAKTSWVLMNTMMGISASGAMFGGGLMAIATFSGGQFELIPVVGIGIAFGAIYAAVVAVPVTLVGLLISIPARSSGNLWLPGEMRWFAIGSGFSAGFLSIAIPTSFEIESLVFALVPAVVGLFGTWFSVEWFAIRKAINDPFNESKSDWDLAESP